ncbi:hypothetical protein [Moraxella lacunata]|uniref:hypothetical protein n=1 Tax=Moraxella lacunata TaxID=477 RepID=UPI003EE3319D
MVHKYRTASITKFSSKRGFIFVILQKRQIGIRQGKHTHAKHGKHKGKRLRIGEIFAW